VTRLFWPHHFKMRKLWWWWWRWRWLWDGSEVAWGTFDVMRRFWGGGGVILRWLGVLTWLEVVVVF
jgi:hypothetical protein